MSPCGRRAEQSELPAQWHAQLSDFSGMRHDQGDNEAGIELGSVVHGVFTERLQDVTECTSAYLHAQVTAQESRSVYSEQWLVSSARVSTQSTDMQTSRVPYVKTKVQRINVVLVGHPRGDKFLAMHTSTAWGAIQARYFRLHQHRKKHPQRTNVRQTTVVGTQNKAHLSRKYKT